MGNLATEIICDLKGRLGAAQSNISDISLAVRKAYALSYALADAIDGTVISSDEASTALFGICDILDTAKGIAEKEDEEIGKYLNGGWDADKIGTNSPRNL